ncbi:DUF3293 domain-containing protein [Propionivibrio sp.]|uniref:DUF3293 domain-containing protein n=1 Tax=Propionivibrio sp. TaxID=2212460 RepID=UPI003BF17FC4
MRTDAIEAAFRATTYRVETIEGVFDLRIGELNSGFDDFLRKQGVSCWGLLTACNPGGVRCDAENPLRQTRLRERLQALGWPCLTACNLADDGLWPAEPGCLLLQVSEKEVCNLAAELFQLACVCGNIGAAPRLVWI